jgi:phosphoglycerate dehydrogenase-like enzyme
MFVPLASLLVVLISAAIGFDQIAIETGGGTKPLVFIAGSLSDADVVALSRSAPNVTIVQVRSAGDALEHAPNAHGIDARFATTDVLRAAPNLVWVQSSSAGVERYLVVEALRENDAIVLTNMQGVHGPTIAEHAFAMLLTLTRNLQEYTNPETKGSWRRSRRASIALNGKTIFVVGLGGIGSEVAKIGNGFGMRVLATRRSEKPKPHYVDEQGLPGDLDRFLGEADVVVLSVPLTDETRGMIGTEQLALMKEGAYLINVARGPVVDTDALVAALEREHLAGACLDVTDPEPLPKDHPLWSFENVIITPHVSGRSELTSKVWKETYLENIRRFAAGEPLLNVVDKAAGY